MPLQDSPKQNKNGRTKQEVPHRRPMIFSNSSRHRNTNENGNETKREANKKGQTKTAIKESEVIICHGEGKPKEEPRKKPIERLRTDRIRPAKHRAFEKYNVPELVEIDHQKSQEEWEMLNKMIKDIYESTKLTDREVEDAKRIIAKLTKIIQKEIPESRLDIFGSVVNGCGSSSCDYDVCFRFAENLPPPNKVPLDVIISLQKILKRNYRKDFVKAINCRVPIVKMKVYGKDIDISYYNDTALQNTALFRKYCEWEPNRFPQLVLWTKRWAKDMKINSSQQKTVSSYALTLMLIHYLQKCEPPVFPGWKIDQEEVAEDYDFAMMPTIPDWSQNISTIGQLFVGFLDYYSRFDYNKLISIIRMELIDRSQKLFDPPEKDHVLAIEDPYLVKFNPGNAVTRNKFNKVLGAFRQSRQVFMEEMKESFWNADLIKKCSAFIEEKYNEHENAFIERKVIVEEKKVTTKALNIQKERDSMIDRIFKAVIACRGEGRVGKLIKHYNRLSKSFLSGTFYEHKENFFGPDYNIFSNPFLERFIEYKSQNSYFLVKKEIIEPLQDVVDKLISAYRSEDKNIATGVDRIQTLLQEERWTTEEFLFDKYKRTHKVAFDDEERMKYFGTTNLLSIMDILRDHGICVHERNQIYKLRIKSVFVDTKRGDNFVPYKTHNVANSFIHNLRKQFKREKAEENANNVAEEIAGLELDPENTQKKVEEGIQRIKRAIKINGKYPVKNAEFKNSYKNIFSVQFNFEERKKYFGNKNFKEILKILDEYGITSEEVGKNDYIFVINDDKVNPDKITINDHLSCNK